MILCPALRSFGGHREPLASKALWVRILKAVMLVLALSIFLSNYMCWLILANVHQVLLPLTKQLLLPFLKSYMVLGQFIILFVVYICCRWL